jgi:DNA-binding transcriptional MerR regulator
MEAVSMNKLTKIRDVSLKYEVSARALKYYEDMGLLQSTKSDDYAYRLYDEAAVKRLEQILILRRLNIKIKDIQRIFDSAGSEVVLAVLGQKVTDIDDEVALLHELKLIVLDFIRQIKSSDFNNGDDVKLLYEKVRDIEQLVNVDYNGNSREDAASVRHLIDVAEKLEKKPDVRIVELPPCRMVTSGISTEPDLFAPDGRLMRFNAMWSRLDARRKDRFFARDFMWYDPVTGGTAWWFALEDWMTEADTEGYGIIDFEGGIYAAAVSRDLDEHDGPRVYAGILDWITNGGCFELDERPGHYAMYHICGTPKSDKILGYGQLEIFRPVRARTNT